MSVPLSQLPLKEIGFDKTVKLSSITIKSVLNLALFLLQASDRMLSKKTDGYGNQFLYRAKVKDSKGEQLGRWVWDVVLVAP